MKSIVSPVRRPRRLPARAVRHWAIVNLLALAAMIVISVLASHDASAQAQTPMGVLGKCPSVNTAPLIPGTNIPSPSLNVLPNLYCVATLNWLTNAMTAAQRFFFILVGIELAWSALLWTLQKENLGELVTAFILKLMGIFFFYTLILLSATWLPPIMNSFIGLAGQVTGQTIDLDPMVVFSLGTNICNEIFQHLPPPGIDTNVGDYLFVPRLPITLINDMFSWLFFQMIVVFAAVISFVVFAAFLIAAGQLIMTLIEAYIMIGAGAVMLGFTGSRWTMSFGEKWIGYSFAIGVKLFVTYIIVALGTGIFPAACGQGTTDGAGICPVLNAIRGANVGIDVTNPLATIANIGIVVNGYLEIGAAAIIFMMLCQRLPSLAASMMNGSPSLSAGAAMATAMQVAGVITGVVKAGAGAAMGVAGAAAGGGGMGGAEGAGGGGLSDAASLGGGVEGGGSMSPMSGHAADGGGGGSMMPVGASSNGSGSTATGSSANGSLSNGSTANGSLASGVNIGGSGANTASANASSGHSPSANGSASFSATANGAAANESTGSPATASGATGRGGVGGPAAANGANDTSASEKHAKQLQTALAMASAIGNGVDGAASSILAPLTKFDEGQGGGSVHIGLKLPE